MNVKIHENRCNHFIKRLYNRYGISITKEEYDEILKSIKREELEILWIKKQSATRNWMVISIKEKNVMVVHRKGGDLLTAISPWMVRLYVDVPEKICIMLYRNHIELECTKCVHYKHGWSEIRDQIKFCENTKHAPKYLYKSFKYCAWCGNELTPVEDKDDKR